MRFVDFLKSTVLLSAGAATALATVFVLAIAGHSSQQHLAPLAVGWWVLAALIGIGWFGPAIVQALILSSFCAVVSPATNVAPVTPFGGAVPLLQAAMSAS